MVNLIIKTVLGLLAMIVVVFVLGAIVTAGVALFALLAYYIPIVIVIALLVLILVVAYNIGDSL